LIAPEDAAALIADVVIVGFENVPPRELRQRAWLELAAFDITHIQHRVERAAVINGGFEAHLDGGRRVHSKAIILAGGMRYLPSVDAEGIDGLWGTRVFHCPFCHGWEVRGTRIAVIAAKADQVAHATGMLALWSDDVHPITDAFSAVRECPNGALEVHHAGRVTLVDAVLCAPQFEAVDDLPEQLGLTRSTREPMFSEPLAIDSDDFGATGIDGVYVAGDLTSGLPSVPTAIASGAMAAFGVVRYVATPGVTRISRS